MSVEPLRAPPPLRRPEPAPSRAPERQRLAAAIERHRAATDRLSRIRTATPTADDRAYAARRAVDAAEVALGEAKANESRRLAAVLIGDPDDGSPTLADVAATLTAAKTALALARATCDALQEQEDVAERDLDNARRDRDQAIAAIVATSAAVAKLLAENDAARRCLAESAAVLSFLGLTRLPPAGQHWDAEQSNAAVLAAWHSAVPVWEAALAAFEAEPDEVLPGDSDEPAPEAA